jgi:hypothetical protein
MTAELPAGTAFADFGWGTICTLPSDVAWNANPMAQNCTTQAILAARMHPFIIV